MAAQFEEADAIGRQAAIDQGNTVYKISADELERWKQATASIQQGWVDAVSKRGVNGQQLYDEAISLVDQYSK